MLKKIINFIKYNNAVVFIILALFVIGSGVFAQTETGQELIGQKQTVVKGIDNTLLLEADLDNFDMDFKIEKIESDEKYYYVTYTFLDLKRVKDAWQYEMQEKTRKISKRIEKDLGDYLAEEFSEQYSAKIKKLKEQQAKQSGEKQTRTELTKYNGLIGKTLVLAKKVFPDYEAIKVREIPSPKAPSLLSLATTVNKEENKQAASNLEDIYNNYIQENDPDQDNVFGDLDNCPNAFNPLQEDSDGDGLGDICDLSNDEESATTTNNISVEDTTSEETSPIASTSGETDLEIESTTTEAVATSTETKQPEEEVEIIELH